MKLRALGRVNVCAASSSIAAYASTSTTIPEHLSQISSVPISSRAHASGSRLKNAERIISSPVFSVFSCLLILQRRQVRLSPSEGERTKVRGFRGCPPALRSTYPHSPLLPPQGEAPAKHAYIRGPSRCDNHALAT